jgi:SAM-dependent methyltransferase
MRQSSPAAERNRGPLGELLARQLPATGRALEIASGTGQHAVHFAGVLPGWTWQPSDPSAEARASIAAWCAEAGTTSVLPPLALDVLAPPWPVEAGTYDLVFCANMLHISPWATCAALMAGAARALRDGGRLVTYGPYLEDDVPTAPGNVAFDADLRARDAAWGIRRREDVVAAAEAAGFAYVHREPMPANNLTLVFRRGPAGPAA